MTRFSDRLKAWIGPEMAGPGLALVAVILVFGLASPQFLSAATFGSVAFQLPELGLLTLAMLLPILTGGLNLAVTFTANIAGLTLAWVLQANGGADAGAGAFALGCVLAVTVGAASGVVMGLVIAFTRAHPILVSLSMMIFLRGLGEFLTRGGDVSGFPAIHRAARPWFDRWRTGPVDRLHRLRARLACAADPNQARLQHLHDRLKP